MTERKLKISDARLQEIADLVVKAATTEDEAEAAHTLWQAGDKLCRLCGELKGQHKFNCPNGTPQL